MKFITGVALLAFAIATHAANPVVFNLHPINLANGWQVTGTITTDGTVGPLTSGNLIDWNLKTTQTTDLVWTEKDSNNLNLSGVSTDGKNIYVATSPDGVKDGGTLFFSRGGALGNIPTSAVLADFTQTSVNLGYGLGGIAGWQDELGGLNFIGLNQRDKTDYRAASLVSGKPNIFSIHVPTIATSPTLMRMFGTVTTDGTIGSLLPKNIVAWKVTARNQEFTYFTKANSSVMFANGVSTDGNVIKVDHNATSQLVIGFDGRRPTFVTLADFTDLSLPNGFANYYSGIFGLQGDKSPLVGPKAVSYIVAKH